MREVLVEKCVTRESPGVESPGAAMAASRAAAPDRT